MLKLKIDNEYNNMYMVFFSLEKKKKIICHRCEHSICLSLWCSIISLIDFEVMMK